jgi:aspartate/methionine/tyrosine aminotransferase
VFSPRTPAPGATNRLTRALAARRRHALDLTVTNPTAVGLSMREEALALLSDPRGVHYSPDPKGLPVAREAVARFYANRGVPASPDRIVLTASSSEAYSWLFKLLASPGDVVLVPAPSYPLLDALAALESVALERYRLDAADGWRVHAGTIEAEVDGLAAAGRRVAAVVLVAPNNPTGSGIRSPEMDALCALAARRGFALISDEVFLDYRFEIARDEVDVAAGVAREGLVFSLGGLSKSAALPQLKLGWILANGPGPLLSEALERLDWIADSFLSVGTPVQLALPDLLVEGEAAASAIRARVLSNAAELARAFPPGGAASVEPLRAGWSAVLRVPAVAPEEDLVLRLLEEDDVLVHPGYFFEFPFEAFFVLSLLPAPEVFREGVARLARALEPR